MPELTRARERRAAVTVATHRGKTPEAKAPQAPPATGQQLVLDTQRSAGNKAVSGLATAAGSGGTAVQRDLLGSIKSKLGMGPKTPPPPTPTHEKTKASEMTSDAGQKEMARVKQQVQDFIDL